MAARLILATWLMLFWAIIAANPKAIHYPKIFKIDDENIDPLFLQKDIYK